MSIALPSSLGFLLLNIPSEYRPPFTIGSINLIAFFVVILMTLLTTPIGVRLAHAMDPKPLKRFFVDFYYNYGSKYVEKSVFIWNMITNKMDGLNLNMIRNLITG